MALRDELSRILGTHSVTDVSKELSLLLGRQAEQAIENGDVLYGERLGIASTKFWEMEDIGL
jgi:hypothetical protein